MNVLIVDDSPTQRALWMYALSDQNIQITSAQGRFNSQQNKSSAVSLIAARDAEQAIEYLETTPVDLVITDVDMPGMNGWDLAAKAQSMQPKVPIVVISSKVTTRQAPPVALDGLRTHVFSKFDRKEAVQCVHRILATAA